MTKRGSGPSSAKIVRAVRAVKAGGMALVRIEIDGDKMVLTEIPAPIMEPQDDLDKWRARRARKA